MKAFVIKPKNSSEEKFISDLLKMLGIASRMMNAEEIEDYGLGLLMKQADRSKKVSRDTVMKKLRS